MAEISSKITSFLRLIVRKREFKIYISFGVLLAAVVLVYGGIFNLSDSKGSFIADTIISTEAISGHIERMESKIAPEYDFDDCSDPAYVIDKEAIVLSEPFEDAEVIDVLEKYDNVVLTGTNSMAYQEVTLPDGTVGYIDNDSFSTDIQAVGEMKAAESTFLLKSNIVDPEYHGTTWSVEDRELLERIVTREYGADYNGSVLVCQIIRDIMVYEDCHTMGALVNKYRFNGYIYKEPTQIAKDAIAFVFDEGGSAVQHRIMAYYASDMMYSDWHESQKLVIQYQDSRFFDMPSKVR